MGSESIKLPQGGGAVKGIGETFQPNLFTGTGNFSVPIYSSPGRSNFNPDLSLQYSTGNGNSPFGAGWQLSVPQITRKTEKGLPKYNDHDVFVLSGAEDLVPVEVIDGEGSSSLTIVRYQPRTEGLFARIEHYVDERAGTNYWQVTTKDNITNIYGKTANARIQDIEPVNQITKIYSWLLQETYDAKGNHMLYEYAGEADNLSIDKIYEQDRNYQSQRYIRRIYYGNTPDALDQTKRKGPVKNGRHYSFELLFDYHDLPDAAANAYQDSPDGQVEILPVDRGIRLDPFSSYRSGFEVRTLRRCKRALMIHHFDEQEVGAGTIVKSTDFTYEEDGNTQLSFLQAATIIGYKRNDSGYTSAPMPAVEFGYTAFQPQEQRYESITAKGNDLPPIPLSDPNLALVDLTGNGLSDLLHTTANGFRFWENLGNGQFDRPRMMSEVPAGLTLDQAGVSFADLSGNGRADLLTLNAPSTGFFETTGTTEPGKTWNNFKPITSLPALSPADPNVRLVDLTGDGLSDMLMTHNQQSLLWTQCLGDDGYGEPRVVPRNPDMQGLFFNDSQQRVRLADMTGDGLNDIVLLHNGRIEYWPNLGYGRFGKRIIMQNPPRLEVNFDPARLLLADIDGSGCTDLVYVDANKIYFWFNQSGNAWSVENVINGTPITTNLSSIQFADVFGRGTSCLLWSYDLGTVSGSNYKVLDFCGGTKPYLLTEMSNNMGATTRVRYASSTDFYLQDVAENRRWLTSLPFPVHVLAKSEVVDHLSKTKLTTTYRYHHGYFDGREREFRGFGRVDQFDTETFFDFTENGLHGDDIAIDNAIAEILQVPPVETRTWFHTGAFFDETSLLDAFAREYWQDDTQAFSLPEHVANNSHEAHRALRGSQLRQEVYAHDNTDKEAIPYTVSMSVYEARELRSPQYDPAFGTVSRGIYLTLPQQSQSYHYERNPDDPRIQQTLNLEFDEHGNNLRSIGIIYPRRIPQVPIKDELDKAIVDAQGHPVVPHVEQTKTLATYTFNRFNKEPDIEDCHYIGLNVETKVFELNGLSFDWSSSPEAFEHDDFQNIAELDNPNDFVPFESSAVPPAGQLQKRLVDWKRSYFKGDSNADSTGDSARLPLGEVEKLGLPFESYQIAFTEAHIKATIGDDPFSDQSLQWGDVLQEGGYQQEDGFYWIPSGRMAQDDAQLYLPTIQRDPFGNEQSIQYDVYSLLATEVTDAIGNTVKTENNYRVLQPQQVTDPNNSVNAVIFDSLGMVVATAQMGKVSGSGFEGDTLVGLASDLNEQQIIEFFSSHDAGNLPKDPRAEAAAHLHQATTRIIYDLQAYQRSGQPVSVATISREIHTADLADSNSVSPVQVSFLYSDGFGRELQTKVQAEPDTNSQALRWVATGKKFYNNKGKPTQEYEPYFEDHYGVEITQKGVSSTLIYDPLERVVVTLLPDQSYEKVTFDVWQQQSWDGNDTILLNPQADPDVYIYFTGYQLPQGGPTNQTWHDRRINDAQRSERQRAAKITKIHAATPTTLHLDTLGRPFLKVEHKKHQYGEADSDPVVEELIRTHTTLDIEGNDTLITDPRGIEAFSHEFDIAGRKLVVDSKDAGKKMLLADVMETPIYSWDANGNRVRNLYDALRRPTEMFVKQQNQAEFLAQKTIYGESKSNAELSNHRGQVWKVYDSAGLVINDSYNFKGSLLATSRKLLSDGKEIRMDWLLGNNDFDETAVDSALEAGSYTTRTEYDALNRVILNITPDGTRQQPVYNDASLLESLSVTHSDGKTQNFVSNINYNAKGQRARIEYGNGVITDYVYDSRTFRLNRLTSKRGSRSLQDLSYTYDPVGNITAVRDDAHKTIFNCNGKIEPVSQYKYDALYRLIKATGREHTSMTPCHYQNPNTKHTELIQPLGNCQSLGNYVESYHYDASGNVEEIRHHNTTTGNARPTRVQEYTNDSNRIFRSKAGCAGEDTPFQHDANGNMVNMPHLPGMQWDYRNQLVEVQLTAVAAGNNTNPDMAYYQYDGGGQRIRKLIAKGTRTEERIYLGGYEVFRVINGASNTQLHRDTIHIMDDTARIALIEVEKDVSNPTNVTDQRVRYQLNNHLGSSTLELDDSNSAEVISYEEYYTYGGTAYLSGDDLVEVKKKRYRYSGKERDDETGFYYYGARYYCYFIIRWMAVDPLGYADSLNLYRFLLSNPVNNFDRYGFSSEGEASNKDKSVDAPDSSIHRSTSVTVSDGSSDKKLSLMDSDDKTSVKKSISSGKNKKSLMSRLSGNIYAHVFKFVVGTAVDPGGEEIIDPPRVEVKGDRHDSKKGDSGEQSTRKNPGASSPPGPDPDPPKPGSGGAGKRSGSTRKFFDSSKSSSQMNKEYGKLINDLRSAAENATSTKTAKNLLKLADRLSKLAPGVGVVVSLAVLNKKLSKGDFVGAAEELISIVPGLGEVYDSAKLGYDLGTLLSETGMFDDSSQKTGDAVKGALKGLGIPESAANLVGALSSSLTAIGIATNPLSLNYYFFKSILFSGD